MSFWKDVPLLVSKAMLLVILLQSYSNTKASLEFAVLSCGLALPHQQVYSLHWRRN